VRAAGLLAAGAGRRRAADRLVAGGALASAGLTLVALAPSRAGSRDRPASP